MQFGANVRALRDSRGMTVQQLADMVGMGQSQLSKVEKDSVWIGKEYLVKLADALNVPISEFFREKSVVSSEGTHVGTDAVLSNRLPIWDYASALKFIYPSRTPMPKRKTLSQEQRYIAVDKRYPEGSFALDVSDDAMAPLISKGMSVIVDTAREPRPSDIVVVFFREANRDQISLRFFHDRPGGKFEAVPRNRAFRTLSPDEGQAEIVGVVALSSQEW